MATINAIDASSAGGIKNISDLYNLISGTTTSTSGGTVTTNQGISQESMNAMLKSALESSNGLAAISGGQRTAGGYGSSVNTMLTNDLLTRTAGQIAQAAQTKTVTTTPTTTTTGGVTAEGAAKSAGFVAALTALNKTGANEWLKKNVFSSGEGAESPIPTAATSSTNATSDGSDVVGNAMQSAIDSSNAVDYSAGGLTDQGALDSMMQDTTSPPSEPAPVVDTPAPEPIADSTDPIFDDFSFADGGSVSRKQTNLSTSQYSRGSPEINAVLQGAGVNAPNLAVTGTAGSNPILNGVNKLTSDGSSNSNSGTVGIGAPGTPGLGTIGTGLSAVAAALGNSTLGHAGFGASVAGSNNPGMSAAVGIGNAATHGALGVGINAANAISNPTTQNVTDTVASATPIGATINAMADVFGFATIGQFVANAMQAIAPNQMMTPAQEQIAKAYRTEVETEVETDTTPDTESTTNADANTAAASDNADSTSSDASAATGDSASGDSGGNGGDGASGDGAGSGSGGDGAGDADGGHIQGPGTSISDSIPAKLSDGEFVISADVVKAVGIDKLQALQDKYHVPAAVQKLKSYAR